MEWKQDSSTCTRQRARKLGVQIARRVFAKGSSSPFNHRQITKTSYCGLRKGFGLVLSVDRRPEQHG